MPSSPRQSRSTRGCLIAAIAYVAITWICVWLLENPLRDSLMIWRAVVSLLPLIPIGFAIREVLRLVAASDELQRRMDLEALVTAAVVVGLGSLTLSLLVSAGVVVIAAKTALAWVLPALSVLYVLARIWTRRRYQ